MLTMMQGAACHGNSDPLVDRFLNFAHNHPEGTCRLVLVMHENRFLKYRIFDLYSPLFTKKKLIVVRKKHKKQTCEKGQTQKHRNIVQRVHKMLQISS